MKLPPEQPTWKQEPWCYVCHSPLRKHDYRNHHEPHEHQYTVVVEWEQLWQKVGFYYQYIEAGKRATKVMCPCGEIKEL